MKAYLKNNVWIYGFGVAGKWASDNINSNVKDLKDILNASDEPLNSLQENVLCPGSDNLEKINLTLK